MRLFKTPAETERDDLAIGFLNSRDPELCAAAHQFGLEMASKLGRKLREGKCGWSDEEWSIDDIKGQLMKHVAKGDPVDVANFALFWWAAEQRVKEEAEG